MARRGGLLGRLRKAFDNLVERVTSGVDVTRQPDEPSRSPGSDYSGGGGDGGSSSGGSGDSGTFYDDGYGGTGVTDSDNPPGADRFPFDFELSGFLEREAFFKDDYVNLEGEVVYLDGLPWADMDYFVIRVDAPGRDVQYTTIVGPFDDYDDLLDAIAEWWEEGS